MAVESLKYLIDKSDREAEDKTFEAVKDEVFTQMENRKGKNYTPFLRALRSFKFLAANLDHSIERAKFLESYYGLMRYMDDIADGDLPVPNGVGSADEFIQQKLDFSKEPGQPKDRLDEMFLYCQRLGGIFGQDFSQETHDIWESLLFDAKRRDKNQVFSESELKHHFHLLDIRGTISGTLKVFGEDPEAYKILEPLGEADRIYYNLRDYDEDLKAGFINIPSEDFLKYGITLENIKDKTCPEIQKWFFDQAKQGLMNLEEYHKRKKDKKFKLLTSITLPLVYERTAKKFLEDVVKNNGQITKKKAA